MGELQEKVDIAVVGAGPAGLLCARVLTDLGHRVVVLDAGGGLPTREAAQGIGGAGLYSDGKFSFAPAGTAVWSLLPDHHLAAAYGLVANFLAKYTSQAVPVFEPRPPMVGDSDIKSYPSFRIPMQQRRIMIAELADGLNIRMNSRVRRVDFGDHGYMLEVESPRGVSMVSCSSLVLSTGRLWEAGLAHPFETNFRRYEVGIRVQQRADEFFLRSTPELDPKWIVRLDSPEREYRTFCTCRNGHVVPVRTRQGILVSGHTDPPLSAFSNVGVTVRYLAEVGWRIPRHDEPFTIPYSDARASPELLEQLVGSAAGHLLEALEMLGEAFNCDLGDSTLHGPCVEGVATYPRVEPSSLQVTSATSAWVAGDASGMFRGLVPAMTSGAYVALSIDQRRKDS